MEASVHYLGGGTTAPQPDPAQPSIDPPALPAPPAEQPPSPIVDLARQAVESAFQVGRHQTAMIEMLCGLGSMINLTIAATRAMRTEDVRPMAPVTGRLVASLRELATLLEAKQPSLY